MNKAQLEDLELSKVRNVGLDVVGIMHIMEAYNSNKVWECGCFACQYVRSEPRLVKSIYKNLSK